jgi:predicted ATP-dependent serine protease
VRPVSQTERRLGEAAKMGMRRAFLAERGVPRRAVRDIEVIGVRTVGELFERLFR